MIRYVPIRDLTVLPGVRTQLNFGRRGSVEAVLSALEAGQPIAFSTQHNWEQIEPTAGEVYSIGVVSSVLRVRNTGRGTIFAELDVEDAVLLEPRPELRQARVLRTLDRPHGVHDEDSRRLVRDLLDRCFFDGYAVPQTPGQAADHLAVSLLQSRPLDQQVILETACPHARLRKLSELVNMAHA